MSRIVIFANGQLSQAEMLRSQLRPSDRIFCADGGTRHALALGLTPQIIIGDLDSLAPSIVAQMESAGVIIYRHPVHKDQTDLELAFELAVAAEPDEILLVTARGGRLDHTLGNIFLLTKPEYASVRIKLLDGPQWATVLHPHQSLSITGQPGDTLSLIPLTTTVSRVNLTNVEWPLEEATLFFGNSLSLSNVLIAPPAQLQIGEGLLLLVYVGQTSTHLEEYQ